MSDWYRRIATAYVRAEKDRGPGGVLYVRETDDTCSYLLHHEWTFPDAFVPQLEEMARDVGQAVFVLADCSELRIMTVAKPRLLQLLLTEEAS